MLRSRLRPWLQPANQTEENIRSVLIDGAGVGVVVGLNTFLPVFLARLGASPLIVGLLTSMPALTGLLLALPTGRFLERQQNPVPWYSRSRLWVQGSVVVTGLAPFLVPLEWVPLVVIMIWAIATIPQTVVNITFTLVMGAVAGPDRRYYLMSRRWSMIGIVSAVIVALAGIILERLPFPLNYQVVFIASFVGGMLSYLFSSRISIPDNPPQPPAVAIGWKQRVDEWTHALQHYPAYTNFLLAQIVWRFGFTMALPLFPLYWVRQAQASDFWIGMINTVSGAVLLIGYFAWSVLSRRRGNRIVLLAAGFGTVLAPILTASTEQVAMFLLIAGLSGIFQAGIDLVLFDILLDTCPKERQAEYVALYQMTTYGATLVAPLLGTALGDWIGLGWALVIAGGIRLVGMGLFTSLAVAKPRQA